MIDASDIKKCFGTCEKCDAWSRNPYNEGWGECHRLIEEHWSEVDADYLLVPRRVEEDFFCAYFKEGEFKEENFRSIECQQKQ